MSKIMSFAIVVLVLLGLSACTGEPTSYRLDIDTRGYIENGKVEVYFTGSTVGDLTLFSQGVIKDGQCLLSGNTDHPRYALVSIEGEKEEGSAVFMVLEAGSLKVKLRDAANYSVEGGDYNQLLIPPWRNDPEYSRHREIVIGLLDKHQGIPEEPADKALFSSARDKAEGIQNSYLSSIFESHDDPLSRYFALRLSSPGSVENMLTKLQGLSDELGQHPGFQRYVELRKNLAERQSREAGIVDNGARDFSAPDLHGKMVNFKQVYTGKRYVLLDFWASWCAPCRQQVPYMKSAYQRYADKGFDIVGFSLDDDRAAWETASEEEELTWWNLSDLQASDGEVATLYGVTRLPSNYLIDQQGNVVAVDLWGNELLTTLERLMAEP